MNEKGSKRREWVKTAAIIFLSVLLVLTFFSNTIMNYSLPEVAAQYVQSGTITAKIRGTGVVESGDPYNVMVNETRKVASVAVKAGDTVQKGDVLVYLEDQESDELKAAQEALETARDNVETAQNTYYAALLSADINTEVLQSVGESSVSGYLQRIVDAHTAVEQAQKEVDDWTQKVNAFKTQISITPENDADVSAETKALNEAKTAKENADFALTEAQNRLKAIESQLEYENSVSDGNAGAAGNIDELIRQRNQAQLAVISAQTAADNANLAYERAQTALENKTATGDNASDIASLQNQQAKAQAELDAATNRLTEKTNVLGEMSQALNLDSQYDAIVKAQEEVAKAEEELQKQMEKSIGAVVTADVAGTVTSINVTAGESTSAANPVAVLQPEGKGFSMSFSVTNDQASRLAVGDKAELVNAWRYEDVEVTLSGIRPDTTDPGQKKLLTFDVTGSVTAGQTLNISVGQKSANYDMIVPNSAIREDNNGKFILIVETKSSPLGNRYYATRVDVEVLASDDTQSAVSGGLYGSEFVITTSTAPVEAGQLVRLAES
ncbi:MAG TPA: HlyD family efflux transporter periplasmic adaptor subunit [Candidatus Acetatifactor stercoripullorum]|uniref:HlyD family efflux transporter periplasmic adaptor subunit n=1 Tax=Candidatus Acetatifactor stercoripullorum TaxID=2838414 RepID=A0A9D1R9L6_9FIRM|nr:HlyD family efflux transporter periplasmic adaptor subunit [uncultured Acetatifactor sp.]HIW82597.1 HlyD family efflux transporter periplasmic adaptor subunit [Candidatus Acetatifactor stercoripullorum]